MPTAKKPTSAAPGVTLRDVLAECSTAATMHPHRATWFASLLRNAVANTADRLAWYAAHPEHRTADTIARLDKQRADCAAAAARLATIPPHPLDAV